MANKIMAVVVGYLLWTLVFLGGANATRLSNPGLHDEKGFTTDTTILTIYLVISIVASLASGFAVAKLARESKWPCAIALAICLLATGIPVQWSAWNDLPVWYNLAFLILLVPVTLIGAVMGGANRVVTNPLAAAK